MSFSKIINNVHVLDNLSLTLFFKHPLNFGIRNMYGLNFFKRFEKVNDFNILNMKNKHLINYFFNNIIPEAGSFKNRYFIHIYSQSFMNCYKSWRQLKGLPSNGQRSWSNGWTPTRNNNLLRNFKFRIAKKFLKEIPTQDHSIAYSAELENYFWKIFWFNEWQTSRVLYELYFLKKVKNLKVDLTLMSRGLVGNFSKIGKNATQPKKHKKHSNATLGFDCGFTKIILDPVKNIHYSIKLLKNKK